MLKHAYELGLQKALEEEGLTKEAFLGQALTRGISMLGKIPGGSKMIGWGVQHPLAAKTLGGAAVGGVGGGLFGGEGGFARGALLGAGVGAGAHGGRMLGLGRTGRGAESMMRRALGGNLSQKAMQSGRLAKMQDIVGRRAGRAGMYALGGGVGAGALGEAVAPSGEKGMQNLRENMRMFGFGR